MELYVLDEVILQQEDKEWMKYIGRCNDVSVNMMMMEQNMTMMK